jgi:acyl carrier protein
MRIRNALPDASQDFADADLHPVVASCRANRRARTTDRARGAPSRRRADFRLPRSAALTMYREKPCDIGRTSDNWTTIRTGISRTMTIRSTILSERQKIAVRQNRSIGALTDDLTLLDSGFDSLCFAILVAQLEDDLGLDPFSSEQVEFPVTLGDFIKLYEHAGQQ